MMHRCIVLSLCFLRIPVQGIVRSWSKIHDTYLSCMELWDTSCWAWIIYRLYRMAHSHNQMHRTGKKYAFCRRGAVFCTSDQSNEKTLQSGDQVYSSYNADHIFFLYHRVLKTFYVFCKKAHFSSNQLNPKPADFFSDMGTLRYRASGTFFVSHQQVWGTICKEFGLRVGLERACCSLLISHTAIH